MEAESKYFKNVNEKKGLGGRTARGGLLVVFSSTMRFGLQLLLIYMLSKMLQPDDFGLVAMATVLVSLVSVLNDFGLVQATIQKPRISHEEVSNLFWLNLFINLSFSLLFILSARFIANFFSRDELIGITYVYAVTIFVQGVSQQHRAIMMRAMEYRAIEFTELAGYIVGVMVALFLATVGAGYWALVSVPLTAAIIRTIFFPFLTRWVPSLPDFRCSIRMYLHYGLHLMGFNGVNYFARNADNLLIGKVVGAEALGYYSLAYRILLLPINQLSVPLTKVMLPALSRIVNEPMKYRKVYELALGALAAIAIPVIVFLFVFAEDLILLLLGEEWRPAAVIFQCLMPVALISATNVATGWVYQSVGTTDRLFKVSIIKTVFLLVAMVVGLNWGPIGVALAVSFVYLFERIPAIIYCYRGTPLVLASYLRPQLYPVLFSIAAVIVVRMVPEYIGKINSGLWFKMFVCGSLYMSIVLLLYLISPVRMIMSETKKYILDR